MKLSVDTMAGRVFAILAAGIVASALLSFWLADRDRQSTLRQVRGLHAVERVAQLVLTLEALPPDDRVHALAGAAAAGFRVQYPASTRNNPPSAEPDDIVTEALARRLGANRNIQVNRWPCPEPEARQRPDERGDRSERGYRPRVEVCRSVFLHLSDGTPLQLNLRAPPPPPSLTDQPGALLWLATFAASIGLLAWLVARMATRPLRQLAAAANELGRQMERPPLPTTGPAEVREAAAAFNSMQERIRHYVQERMRMLAAITHDLQTPMTRLRLRLEKVQDEPLRSRLIGDLASMQAMVKEGLDLVRSLDAPLPLAPLDLRSLLDSLCQDAVEAGQETTLEDDAVGPILIQGNAIALRRCLGNLLDNAVKYGNRAHVRIRPEAGRVHVFVRDEGPGIPEDQLAAVFEPFARLENSRSRDTGGTGLGLTIAREIARRHGGALTLSNLVEGGLEAALELPMAT